LHERFEQLKATLPDDDPETASDEESDDPRLIGPATSNAPSARESETMYSDSDPAVFNAQRYETSSQSSRANRPLAVQPSRETFTPRDVPASPMIGQADPSRSSAFRSSRRMSDTTAADAASVDSTTNDRAMIRTAIADDASMHSTANRRMDVRHTNAYNAEADGADTSVADTSVAKRYESSPYGETSLNSPTDFSSRDSTTEQTHRPLNQGGDFRGTAAMEQQSTPITQTETATVASPVETSPVETFDDRAPNTTLASDRASFASNGGPASGPFEMGTSSGEGTVATEWIVPREVNLHEEAVCSLVVHNTSDVPLLEVNVRVQLPESAELRSTQPRPSGEAGRLSWTFTQLAPGAKETIQLSLVPRQAEIFAPRAQVTFRRMTTTKITVLEPKIGLEIEGPTEVSSGQAASYKLVVHNPGNGTARNVVVQALLDENLKHADGRELRYAVGTLLPGETRRVELPVLATGSGAARVTAEASAGASLREDAVLDIAVVKPNLEIDLQGPKLRYVDRNATYVVKVHNPGPAAVSNIQVFDQLPPGFRFVKAAAGGTFDRQARQVAWFVGRLEPNQSTEVEMELQAIEPGQHVVTAEVRADAGVHARDETATQVEGVAQLTMTVKDTDDPVEVANETAYQIRLENRGSKAATGVQVALELPEEMEALHVQGPCAAQVTENRIIFESLERLEPGKTLVYQLKVRCKQSGQATLRAYFRSQDNPQAELVEERTRIYAD
jgi:uncharacterized repeat protein (TIGR01451 family)